MDKIDISHNQKTSVSADDNKKKTRPAWRVVLMLIRIFEIVWRFLTYF
jgi:hypothetical protein